MISQTIFLEIKLLFKRLAGFLLILSLLRFYFFIVQFSLFAKNSFFEIFMAFIHGIRFDASVTILILSPLILLSVFLPSQWQAKRSYQAFFKAAYLFLGWAVICISVRDTELFSFSGKRLTLSILSIKDDAINQAFSLFWQYWYYLVIEFALVFLLYKIYPARRETKVIQSSPKWPLFLKNLCVQLLVIASFVIINRGGFQKRPLYPGHAFFVKAELAHLSLNSLFTLIRSKISVRVKDVKYFETKQKAMSYLAKPPKALELDLKNHNVVVIVLESFSKKLTSLWEVSDSSEHVSYTPFLDELAKKSIFSKRTFANGRLSIDSLPSILCAIPSILEHPFIHFSNFRGNKISCLPELFSNQGYKTAFFHGAENGSMKFDTFSIRAGFQKYHGLNEFGDTSHSDGVWGIYDEPFFLYMAEEMKKIKKPFFITLFSLSSHNPYRLPSKYKTAFPEAKLPFLKTVRYTDLSLRKFFQSIENEPWFKKTLFIITADHTFPDKNLSSDEFLAQYSIPILFYHPGLKLPDVSENKVIQQIDVPASLIHLFNFKRLSAMSQLGESIFVKGRGQVLNFSDNSFWIMRGRKLSRLTLDGKSKSYEVHGYKARQVAQPNRSEELLLRAYIQYFMKSLLEDSWQ